MSWLRRIAGKTRGDRIRNEGVGADQNTSQPVWYEYLSGVVIRPDKSRHKHRWAG